jgi:hypothetical protein
MATEGHRGSQGKDHQQKTKVEIDKELIEIRAKMERLALKMQQDAKVHWTYEWPLKRKVEWPVQKLMARRQQQMLRRWLRHAENLSNTGRKVIYICEPEVGKILSDDEEERLDKDLINCQVDSDGLLDHQVGNETRSVDFIDFQESRGEIPDFQMGQGKEMNSAESSYQQGVLMEEDQRCVLIVGEIQIFLPNSPVEASTSVAHEEMMQQESKREVMKLNEFKANCVCDAGVAEERQPTKTVKEEKREQTLMSTQQKKRRI